MLQDLDQLAARIGLLVERTRQLHAERDALRARLNDSEIQQRSLQQRCAGHETELQALRAALTEHDQASASLREEAGRAEASLREDLARESAERHALEARLQTREAELQSALQAREAELQAALQARDSDLTRLRTAALAARERIDVVLSRLPGASVGEQH
jgi:chromosome segregation ATPase